MMRELAERVLSDPIGACGLIFIVCAVSLFSAYTAEYMFGLQPCELCLYQRVPYFVSGALSVIGLGLLYKEEWIAFITPLIFVCAASFLANGLLAFYHVGVEQHWWTSILEGCKVNFESGSLEELRALFDKRNAVPCDQIPWADPILGISMAGYNSMLSFGMAAVSAWSALLIRRRYIGE